MAKSYFVGNTAYSFDNELTCNCDTLNYVGVSTTNEINSALSCPPSSDTWVQLFVSKIADIPGTKPAAENIISVNTCVEIISQRVIKTPTVTGYTDETGTFIPGDTIGNAECSHLTGRKLIIEGVIVQKIVYTATDVDQPLYSVTLLIPFSTFIIVDADTSLGREFRLCPYVEDVFTCLLSDRSIFTNNTLFIKASTGC